MRANILLMLILAYFIMTETSAKDKTKARVNWENVNFWDEYNIKLKIPGSSAKSLKSTDTFIASYTIGQAMRMKGSEKTATDAIYSEVLMGEIDQEAFQQMVDEVFQDLLKKMSGSGLKITDGEKVVASDYAQKQKDDDKNFVGKISPGPLPEKAAIMDGAIPGYGVWGVKDAVNFNPTDKNTFVTTKRIYGNFYNKLMTSENVNLMLVTYNITFASFDGGRGYKNISITTKPVISVNPVISILTPKGWSTFTIDKGPIWGNGGWSEGVIETDMRDGTFWGISSKAKYRMDIKQEPYLDEVKNIIINFQDDLVKEIKASL